MATIRIDLCPACGANVSRRFGLIIRRQMACPSCGARCDATRSAVVNNWQFHGAVIPGLLFTVGWVAASLLSEDFRAWADASLFNHDHRPLADIAVVGAVLAGGVGLFGGGLLGRLAGIVAARRLGL